MTLPFLAACDSGGMVAYTIVQGSHLSVYQALTIVQWSCAGWPS
jgi:hypothetical protein